MLFLCSHTEVTFRARFHGPKVAITQQTDLNYSKRTPIYIMKTQDRKKRKRDPIAKWWSHYSPNTTICSDASHRETPCGSERPVYLLTKWLLPEGGDNPTPSIHVLKQMDISFLSLAVPNLSWFQEIAAAWISKCIWCITYIAAVTFPQLWHVGRICMNHSVTVVDKPTVDEREQSARMKHCSVFQLKRKSGVLEGCFC